MPDNALALTDDPMAKQFNAMQAESTATQAKAGQAMDAQIATQRQGAAEMDATRAARPHAEKISEPPKSTMGDDASQWLAAATVMGAIAGAMTRRHTTNALAAFTGVLEGAKEGNQAKFEQNVKAWEMHTKQVTANNKTMLDEYQAVIDDKKLSIDAKMQAAQLVAQKYHDQMGFQLASQKEYVSFMQMYDRRKDAHDRFDLASERLHETKQHNRAMEENAKGAALTPEAQKMLADQSAAGDTSALTNIGRGAQGARNVVGIRNEQAAGGTSGAEMARKRAEFAGQTSGQRALGTREANLGMIANEARNAIPLAVANSNKTKRGGTVAWNQAQGAWEVQTGDAAWAAHVASTNALINLYARAAGGGTWTVSGSEHAREMLNPTMPPQAYNSTVRTISQELNNFLRAPAQTRQQMETGEIEPIGVDGGVPANGLPPGWSIEEVK